jgi:flagellum-specific ATP synthase
MTAGAALLDSIGDASPLRGGRIASIRGLIAEATGISLPVGGMAEIETETGFLPAEVVGFRETGLQLMPLGPTRGIAAGAPVWGVDEAAVVSVGPHLLGRVIDALGRPIDGGPPLPRGEQAPLYREPVASMERPLLDEPLDVGVRAINAAVTLARGQRVGLFAGSGVGKSTLLGMMLRGTDADVRVLGLIGERGREVREFIERELGAARSTTVVVAVPSDSPPLLRARGAWVATAVAEWFRDQGLDVLLMMDSVTRFAFASREVGLARGEPATTKGYTPSVFAELPVLLERAGRTARGSITGVYSVLVEGGDLEDPISDALRAILDGHVVLTREMAERGHFPAIDVLASTSRAMPSVSSDEHRALATHLRRLLAAYRDSEDLIQVGAYARGSDPMVDAAIDRRAALDTFLQQDMRETTSLEQSVGGLLQALGGSPA